MRTAPLSVKKKKAWLEIRAEGRALNKDEVVELLIKAGSPGAVEGSATLPDDRILSHSAWTGADLPPVAVKKGARASLTAYLPIDLAIGSAMGSATDLSDKLSSLRTSLKTLGWTFSSSPYKDIDWSRKWKRFIKPARVSYRKRAIIVGPSWKKLMKRPGDIVVRIDPGMAFGTGSHETTKTCLKALLHFLWGGRLKPREAKVLDVGTGSGVLAIAAKKLGAGSVVAIDIDPLAIRVARANAKINRCKITLSETPVEGIKGSFDIVLANIISRELKRLSTPLVKRLKDGGFLVLSGVLAHEKDGVSEVYASIGLRPVREYLSGEWATLVLARTGT